VKFEFPRCAPEEVGLDADVLAEIGPTIDKMIARGRIPGAVVMVARHGKVVFDQAYGYHRTEEQRPFRRDTIVRIYSMTKPVTSVAALMLIEDGQLSLEASITPWIPELRGLKVFALGQPVEKWPVGDTITVADLLRHTAGLSYGVYGDEDLEQRYRDAKLLARDSTLTEMAGKLADLPLVSQPGTTWNYSLATDVLGLLLERVTGLPLSAFLHDHVFQPLKMHDTAFHVKEDRIDRFAHNYLHGEQRRLELHDDATQSRFGKAPSLYSGGGGLVSTAPDFMKFCWMLSNGGDLSGRRILSPQSVRQMTSNQLDESMMPINLGGQRNGVGFGYGVSVVVGRIPMARFVPIGEYGWSGAASTHFWISPKHDLAVVALTQKMPFTFDLENRVKAVVYRAVMDADKLPDQS
jgi:CubicO group peptidase (beta-lactamase class C family)